MLICNTSCCLHSFNNCVIIFFPIFITNNKIAVMNKILSFFFLLFISAQVSAQNIHSILDKAVNTLLNDPQMKSASFGLYVADASTGELIYQKNGYTILAPASTQKTFTAIAALDILGKDYVYKTPIVHSGTIEDGVLKGDLIFKASGDPSLASWRYDGYKYADVKKKFLQIIENAGIRAIDGNIVVDNSNYDLQPLPGGWPWDDIGNYYGAGDWGFNWNENQFDLKIKPGKKEGDSATIIGSDPQIYDVHIVNKLITTKQDDTQLFFYPYSKIAFAEGSVPVGKSVVTASGTIPDPPKHFLYEVKNWLKEKNIYTTGEYLTAMDYELHDKVIPSQTNEIGLFLSPAMERIEYWFMRKSVNLYGEAITKTIALEKNGYGSGSEGVKLIRKFWESKGINLKELKIIDGSGLSPQNAVSPNAEVQALLYAQKQPYYKEFYESMPLYNDMKMKSGTIARCKGFAGYQTSASGRKYVFSILINNYEGSSYSIVPKMYKLLDNLKKY